LGGFFFRLAQLFFLLSGLHNQVKGISRASMKMNYRRWSGVEMRIKGLIKAELLAESEFNFLYE